MPARWSFLPVLLRMICYMASLSQMQPFEGLTASAASVLYDVRPPEPECILVCQHRVRPGRGGSGGLATVCTPYTACSARTPCVCCQAADALLRSSGHLEETCMLNVQIGHNVAETSAATYRVVFSSLPAAEPAQLGSVS